MLSEVAREENVGTGRFSALTLLASSLFVTGGKLRRGFRPELVSVVRRSRAERVRTPVSAVVVAAAETCVGELSG